MIFSLDFLITIFPLFLLIWLMTKKHSLSAHYALPLTALIFYVLMIFYFSVDKTLVHAAIIDGLLTALTPIFIIGGAVLLFKTMEYSGALDSMSHFLNGVTTNKVGQLMIIGWSFSFLIEGVSGFGTPPALAAPLLMGLGFAPVRVAILCLIMNTIPVSFGAVGMPTWFGFSGLELTATELSQIGFQTALLQTAAAIFIPIIALRMIVSTQEIRRSILFIYLSIGASVLPYLITAKVSVEFPTIVGGFIGLFVSIILAKLRIGLPQENNSITSSKPALTFREGIKFFFPLWATVLILLITRLPFLGIKEWLVSVDPFWSFSLGRLGDIAMSSSLVIQLKNILGTDIHWKHALLYVPSFIPFVLVSTLSLFLFRIPKKVVKNIWLETGNRICKPALALLGAMAFVKLMMLGGQESRAVYIGQAIANVVGPLWQYLAVYLGALGIFFSGSNTVSNLIFGPVQDSLATSLGLNRIMTLSLQSVGGAMGNMVCIHNIVAVCSILALERQEGYILKKSFIPMLVYGVIVNVAAIAILFFIKN